MDYHKIKTYLDSFINYERITKFDYPRNFKLIRVQQLLERIGLAKINLNIIHIAGTKGKGSVATFLAYLLSTSHFKVGLYTSPHFYDFRERIRQLNLSRKGIIASKLISWKEIDDILREIKPVLEDLRYSPSLGKLSFFEVYTAIALKYFAEKNLDWIILETGLGGRYDATNVIKPLLTIITHIGYDHTHILGKRLSQIAYEKAGIIKFGIPIITTHQRNSVLEVIRKVAHHRKAPLYILGKDFHLSRIKINPQYSSFDFIYDNFVWKRLKIFLKGKQQVENASLSLAGMVTLKKRGLLKKKLVISEGLKNVYLEGRFEIIKNNPLIIVDIAHNPSSFLALKESLNQYFPHKKIILIFAASKDKDIKAMLNNINYDKIILTKFNNPRSAAPLDIKRLGKLKDAVLTKDIKSAIKVAYNFYCNNHLILISGSFFIVAEAKKVID